jgi:hypothetical protein
MISFYDIAFDINIVDQVHDRRLIGWNRCIYILAILVPYKGGTCQDDRIIDNNVIYKGVVFYKAFHIQL